MKEVNSNYHAVCNCIPGIDTVSAICPVHGQIPQFTLTTGTSDTALTSIAGGEKWEEVLNSANDYACTQSERKWDAMTEEEKRELRMDYGSWTEFQQIPLMAEYLSKHWPASLPAPVGDNWVRVEDVDKWHKLETIASNKAHKSISKKYPDLDNNTYKYHIFYLEEKVKNIGEILSRLPNLMYTDWINPDVIPNKNPLFDFRSVTVIAYNEEHNEPFMAYYSFITKGWSQTNTLPVTILGYIPLPSPPTNKWKDEK